jgi:hypothetical protein
MQALIVFMGIVSLLFIAWVVNHYYITLNAKAVEPDPIPLSKDFLHTIIPTANAAPYYTQKTT